MNKDIETILLKSKTLGLPIETIGTMCYHKIYLIKQDTENSILLIPDDVENISWHQDFSSKGNLEVIGGENLINTNYLFNKCRINKLDLTNMHVHNTKYMDDMFSHSQINEIDFGNFNTYNVVNMSRMFEYCETNKLDLSKFNTSKVSDMTRMFSKCKAEIKVTDSKLIKQLKKDRNNE